MNRRNFLAGSIALAGQHKLLRSMGALSMGEQNAQQIATPHNLLSSTYTESFLESKLAAAGVCCWQLRFSISSATAIEPVLRPTALGGVPCCSA